MNLAIFGAKAEAIYTSQQLTAVCSDLHKVKCFIDNNPQLIGTAIDNLPIVSFRQFIDEYSKDIDAVIIAVRSLNSMSEIVQQLRQSKIQKIGFINRTLYDYDKKLVIDEFGNSDLVLWLNDTNKPVLLHLEANIVDECNLKCKGCTHFSNLFHKESRYDLKTFERDLTQISNHCYITELHLLGGEPLLCDNLSDYVDLSRKILPYSDIAIVTNGLLLFNHSDKLYESARRNDVQFRISPYKPTMKIKDKITEFLKSNGINFSFGNPGDNEISKFNKTLSKTYDSDCEKSMSVCPQRGCHFLRDSKLYKCPVEGMLYKFLDTYNISNDLKSGIDIYNVSDWSKVIKELKNPVDACKYCTETPQLMDWEISAHPDIQDWIVT